MACWASGALTFVDATVENSKLQDVASAPVLIALLVMKDMGAAKCELSRTSEECYQEAWALRKLVIPWVIHDS